jgi:hypothetical protein
MHAKSGGGCIRLRDFEVLGDIMRDILEAAHGGVRSCNVPT